MDWARNRLGDIIAANQSGLSAYGLVCPVCGQPVFKRAGLERRPHFAHYSHRARPDCENYFPPYGVSPASTTMEHKAPPSKFKQSPLRCGLFLSLSPTTQSFSLLLKIPSLSERLEEGTVHIQSGIGTCSFSATDLKRPRFVTLRPQVPLATCSGNGGLHPLAMEIQAELAEFKHGINLFVGGDDGGRRLYDDEPTEWGGRYWIASPVPLEPPGLITEFIEWSVSGHIADWFIYSVSLPRVIAASQIGLRHAVEAFIGRRVNGAKASLYVAYPLPHHFDVDGALVYPQYPERLLLRTTTTAPVTAISRNGAKQSAQRISEDWVELSNFDPSDCEATICMNDREQLLIRIDVCELFRPIGLAADNGDEPIDVAKGMTACASSGAQIECPSLRVAEHLKKLNPDWALEDRFLISEYGRPFDGGNYGLVRDANAAEDATHGRVSAQQSSHVDGKANATQKWLEGVIARNLGQPGKEALRAYLAGTASRLGDEIATCSPLAVHIRSLKAKMH